jgi:hypothetical protein
MTKIKITDISIGTIENNKDKKVKVASEIKLTLPLKKTSGKYWDKVEVGNDWDREYVEAENDVSYLTWEGSRAVPMTFSHGIQGIHSPSKVGQSVFGPWYRKFKSQELLDNYKKYVDVSKTIEHHVKNRNNYNPKFVIKDLTVDHWFTTHFPAQLTKFLKDTNKLFVKDGYGKTTSKEAFKFLKSIIESKEIKSQVKFIPGDEITLGEWLKYRNNSNNNDEIEITALEATALGITPSQPVVVTPQPNVPTGNYQQIIDDLRQKNNDSQAELIKIKAELAKEQVDKHLLELNAITLNDDIKNKESQITNLEQRPNISSKDWTDDYSQRPTKVELDQVKGERDQRPQVSLADYQKLLDIKSELEKWTNIFTNGDAQGIKDQIDQLQLDLKEWTNVFLKEKPSQVNNRINFLKNNQEKHTANDLKPADLPNNWKDELNRLPGLEKRPNIAITEDQWKNDYSQRATQAEFNRVKGELAALNNLKLDFDNLKGRVLKYKIDVINKNWTSLTRRLGVDWSEVDSLYKSYSKELDDLINNNLSLANLENDKMLKMAENTVKRVIFFVASQKAEQKSDNAKQSPSLIRGEVFELINSFDKLIDIGLALEEVETIDNPFYVKAIEQKIATSKTNNVSQINFWKKRLEWDKTTRLLQGQEDDTIEAVMEYPQK